MEKGFAAGRRNGRISGGRDHLSFLSRILSCCMRAVPRRDKRAERLLMLWMLAGLSSCGGPPLCYAAETVQEAALPESTEGSAFLPGDYVNLEPAEGTEEEAGEETVAETLSTPAGEAVSGNSLQIETTEETPEQNTEETIEISVEEIPAAGEEIPAEAAAEEMPAAEKSTQAEATVSSEETIPAEETGTPEAAPEQEQELSAPVAAESLPPAEGSLPVEAGGEPAEGAVLEAFLPAEELQAGEMLLSAGTPSVQTLALTSRDLSGHRKLTDMEDVKICNGSEEENADYSYSIRACQDTRFELWSDMAVPLAVAKELDTIIYSESGGYSIQEVYDAFGLAPVDPSYSGHIGGGSATVANTGEHRSTACA